MELNLNNLEKIHQMLVELYSDASSSLGIFNFNDQAELKKEDKESLTILLEQLGVYFLELSHVNSFLRSCDMSEVKKLSADQQTLFMQCKTLCKSLSSASSKMMQWVVEQKRTIDALAKEITADNSNHMLTQLSDNHEVLETITPQMLQKRQEFIATLKKIYDDLLLLAPENMTKIAGKRLQVMQGKTLFLETEHEMNVFIDYCIFQYHADGKNIAQGYYESQASLYQGERLSVLLAVKNAKFSFLKIIKPVSDYGLIVFDALLGKEFLMLDHGLCQVAIKYRNYAIWFLH